MRKILLSISLLFTSLCETQQVRISAYISDHGQTRAISVDSRLAAKYLGQSLDEQTRQLLAGFDKKELSQQNLIQLARQTSLDFATLYFSERLAKTGRNRQLGKEVDASVNRLRLDHRLRLKPRKDIKIAFVPGLFYKMKPETGGDFARQRSLLKKQGFNVDLIHTIEVAPIEVNGRIIADYIRQNHHHKLVLISASKGGPDVAYALGNLLSSADVSHVKAWVSVGGALYGSPLADKHMRFPHDLWVAALQYFSGYEACKTVRSLSVPASRQRMKKAKFPPHVFILQYVAVPLSGTVSEEMRDPFEQLADHGPSDGIILLADSLLPGAHSVIAAGLDHRFKDSEIDIKTLALAEVVMKRMR